MPVKRAPAGLDRRGRAFWRSATGRYSFSDGELLLLEEACRSLDVLDSLAVAIAGQGVTVAGSKGQTRANPLLVEARGQKLALARLIAALRLPDVDGVPVPSGRSLSASAAAQARWLEPRAAGGEG